MSRKLVGTKTIKDDDTRSMRPSVASGPSPVYGNGPVIRQPGELEFDENGKIKIKQHNFDNEPVDLSHEELEAVFKRYGIDSIYPKAWVDDIIDTLNESEQKQGEESILNSYARSGVTATIDKNDPLQIIKENITKRAKGKTTSIATILISEKAFEPKSFLTAVHDRTGYKELERGLATLKQNLNARNESEKSVVKKHFSKFMNAKSTVDSFYGQMLSNNLITKKDYGMEPFNNALDELQTLANTSYGPVLDRRSKVEKIKITLSILEQWRFFFSLAKNLSDMIKKGRYDAAVRDYKKGKYMMETSFLKSDPTEGRLESTDKDSASLLPKHYQSVFEKLWVAVESVISDFCDELFKSLSIMSNPVETQEKVISYLIELDAKVDPVWCYLDYQYNWVLNNLVKVYGSHVREMKSIIRKLQESNDFDITSPKEQEEVDKEEDEMEHIDSKLKPEKIIPSVKWNLNDMKKALKCVTSESFESEFGLEVLMRLWKQTLLFVDSLCEVLTKFLPAFWKICKIYMDENPNHKLLYANRAPKAKRVQDGHAMVNNIFEIIQTMINYSFYLSDTTEELSDEVESVMSASSAASSLHFKKDYSSYSNGNKPESEQIWKAFQVVSDNLERLPVNEEANFLNANPIMVVHFASRIMETLTRFHADIKVAYSGDDGTALMNSLIATIESVRDFLIEKICRGWVEVSNELYLCEDWSFENCSVQSQVRNKGNLDSTYLLKFTNKLSKFMLRSLAIILVGFEKELDENDNSYAGLVEKIRVALSDSMFGILDGFEFQLCRWRDIAADNNDHIQGWVEDVKYEKMKGIIPDAKLKFGHFIPSECETFVDITKMKEFKSANIRNFMILCNVKYFQAGILPNLCNIFESKFNLDLKLDAQYITESSDSLQRIIVYNFLKKENQVLKPIITDAMFFSGIDWPTLSRPTEVRSYCFHILHHMVYVHASISEVSVILIPTIMKEMLLFLAQELLMAIRQIDRFNIAGMLQVTLEVEYLDSCLKRFETPTSAKMLAHIYEILERATDTSEKPEPEVMAEYMQSVKEYLNEAKTATYTQFRCLGL